MSFTQTRLNHNKYLRSNSKDALHDAQQVILEFVLAYRRNFNRYIVEDAKLVKGEVLVCDDFVQRISTDDI